MFKREELFEKYKKLFEEYYKRKRDIESGNKKIDELQQKKEQIKESLNEDRELCQIRLDQLTEKELGTDLPHEYNEEPLRERKKIEEARELAELDSYYDQKISQLESEISENNRGMQQEIEEEIAVIESDPIVVKNYRFLQEKLDTGMLPDSLQSYFANSSKEAVIEEACLQDTDMVRLYASDTVPFGAIDKYTPAWMEKAVNVFILILIGFFSFTMIFSSMVELDFIRDVSNGLASFLLWLLIAAIAGGIFYLIGQTAKKIGKITGIIGAIIGFLLALQWDIELPYFVTDIIQLVFKIAIVAGIVAISFLVITRTPLSQILSVLLMERVPALCNIARKKENEELERNAAKYYILANYREILSMIISRKYDSKNYMLNQQCQKLYEEKESKKQMVRNSADKKLNQELGFLKSQWESNQKQWEDEQKKRSDEMEQCRKTLESFDKKLLDEEKKHEDLIQKVRDSSRKAEEDQKQYKQEMKDILKELDESKFPEFADIPGVITPSVYILPEWKSGEPKPIQELCHNEKPVLIVYHPKKEEADERTLLYQAMQKLIVEFLGNNPWDALKISVVDTVNSASDLGKAASEELLDIYDSKNISKLYEDIERYTKKNSQNNKWKEDIKERARRSGQMSKELAYRLVFFLIPPNRTSNWFDDRLWNIIGSGANYGFVPVFVVPEREYIKEKRESVYADVDKVVKDQKYDLEMEDGKEDVKINIIRRGA